MKILVNCIVALLIFGAASSFWLAYKAHKNPGQTPTMFGITPIVVLTGSMNPQIKAGDVVIIKKTDTKNLKTGDVITFKNRNGILVTHRIVEKIENKMFKTKGDVNNVDDENLVLDNQILGKRVFDIPYGGHTAAFLKSKTGFLLFLIIPAILLVGGEIRTVAVKNKKIGGYK